MNASLLERLKTTTLDDIRSIDIDDLNQYALSNHDTMQKLYETKILDDNLIDEGLRTAVVSRARKDFHMLAVRGSELFLCADDLPDRSCLAYAISEGVFTDDERKKIPFDEGGVRSFLRLYNVKDLIATLRQRLLNPEQATNPTSSSSCEGCVE